ncbi:hypothetical protein [Brevibacterium sp. HMSC07C04]|uniref:hypothetical protein n=1 Tax=Brevibacterium sp. HMSC07C04 TaxID=1581130 RepID=UPI0008A24EF2|nr:hypothetical protein [Brevibacterium sp. HMSC07C04]OFS26304.1 hypothetical protein HMPREF3162_06795 [Brevibacterium sp. HMSC07C04]
MPNLIVFAAAENQPPKLPDPVLVTPGTIGFVATALVVVATIFLMRDAVRRIRRIRARDGARVEYTIPLRKDGDLEGQQAARPDWKGPEDQQDDASEEPEPEEDSRTQD